MTDIRSYPFQWNDPFGSGHNLRSGCPVDSVYPVVLVYFIRVKSFSFPLCGCSVLHPEYRHCPDKKCFFSAQLASSSSCPPDFLLICTAARCRTCNCDRRRVGQLASSGGGSTGGSTLRIVATWMCAKKCIVFCELAVICQRWFIYCILKVTLLFHFLATLWGQWPDRVDKKGKRHISQRTLCFMTP